jgi:hypothetical protein
MAQEPCSRTGYTFKLMLLYSCRAIFQKVTPQENCLMLLQIRGFLIFFFFFLVFFKVKGKELEYALLSRTKPQQAGYFQGVKMLA